ncbi:MAG TPA: hypothetical protein VGF07_11250 [Stellaceae bacterium]|jgi:hypothetical protein
MLSAAEKKRRQRRRARLGLRVLRVEIDEAALPGALIASGQIGEADALAWPAVERAVARVLRDWSRRWR